MIGTPMSDRDIQVRGWLALNDLPDHIQRAEDATAHADRARVRTAGTRWAGPRQFTRPATPTERILLTELGYDVPDDLTTHVHFRNVLRHRSWPQLETEGTK